MPVFDTPVRDLMTSPVFFIHDGASLLEAHRMLTALDISALPVVDRDELAVGVLSRHDLLRIGRTRQTNGRRRSALSLPEQSVRQHMTTSVETVTADTPLSEAARRLVRQHIHRVYVSGDRRLEGVIGTKEMMHAVATARIERPVGELVQHKLVVVRAEDPVSLAIDRMAAAQYSGLVVVDGGWPVGVFTEADALTARDAPPDDRVDYWLDPRVICVPMRMPAFRAAEQAAATRARRVLAVDGEGVRGVVTGLDFARIVMA